MFVVLMRFNGATAFQPWRSQAVTVLTRGWFQLQWGHSFSAVEILPNGDINWRTFMMLQWGHSFSAVEMFCGGVLPPI